MLEIWIGMAETQLRRCSASASQTSSYQLSIGLAVLRIKLFLGMKLGERHSLILFTDCNLQLVDQR